jgi:GT2 family glycosyltransferase
MDILSGLDEEFEKDPNAYVVCACENMGRSGRQDERMPWYQHSQFRNCCYHFCTALGRESWAKVGGFDERFAAGVAYDDDDFLRSVRRAGLELKIRDDLVALHQWHDKPYRGMSRRRELVDRNKALFQTKWKEA